MGFTDVCINGCNIIVIVCISRKSTFHKQPSGGVPKKRRSENMQQIYRRAPMLKCDFNKVATAASGM